MNSRRFQQTIAYFDTKKNLLERAPLFMFLNQTGSFINPESDLVILRFVWDVKHQPFGVLFSYNILVSLNRFEIQPSLLKQQWYM